MVIFRKASTLIRLLRNLERIPDIDRSLKGIESRGLSEQRRPIADANGAGDHVWTEILFELERIKEQQVALQKAIEGAQSQRVDPISEFQIEGMPIFAHSNELITSFFKNYKTEPAEKYNDFYWLQEMGGRWGDVNVMDVGSNYGQDLLLIAKYLRDCNLSGSIVGYEPNGRVVTLLPHTFGQNAFDVEFVHSAIGAKAGSMILKGKIGNSEDMRIVTHDNPDTYEVVEVRTLDDEVRRLKLEGKPIFAKIDTQGAEWLVFQGASKFVQNPKLLIRTEFTPLMTFGISGQELLKFYLDRFHVIDSQTGKRISEPNRVEFCSDVENNYGMHYTDLYLIPKNSDLAAAI